nr:unnamed protein product [Callosobruchus analis]
MKVSWVIFVLGLIGLSCASPTPREEKELEFDEDPLGYLGAAVTSFIEGFLEQDSYKVSEDVEVSRNDETLSEVNQRSLDLERKIENYVKTHDLTFKLPIGGKITMGARNLDNDELDVTWKFEDRSIEARHRHKKNNIKRIVLPFLVIILLKAIVIVPLALGVLIWKAFQALQLSLISFVISSGLAIFQFARKIAENNAHAHVVAEPPAHAHIARSIDEPQMMAYSAYA